MNFSELVDIDELKEICESFTQLTGAATAILDLEGNILVATGWHDICTCFHRINPETALRCRESDTVLAGMLKAGEEYNVYKCKNGLVDVAVPILIAGEHVANFFTGQFFFEAPDRNYFIRQAEKFGFDQKPYLEALDRVPVFSEQADTHDAFQA
jgi:ligand-binding sensor protein